MKPIMINMEELSESTEVYESRPNPFIVYVIYVIVLLLMTALVWMYCSRLEIVVKSNGLFKYDEPIYEVSSSITGQIETSNVTNGQYVQEGETLFTVKVDALDERIASCQKELQDAQDRIAILQAYEKSLDGDTSQMDALTENPYYQEFLNRRNLLSVNVSSSEHNTQNQVSLYQKNMDEIQASIQQYTVQLEKLQQTKAYISARNNGFDAGDSYYSSIVNSYISQYNMLVTTYDNQIRTYQEQVDQYNRKIEEAQKSKEQREAAAAALAEEKPEETEAESYPEGQETSQAMASAEQMSYHTMAVPVDTEQEEAAMAELIKSRDTASAQIATLQMEKEQALGNLEVQQLASVEQQIESVNSTLTSLKSNLTNAQIQKDSAAGTDTTSVKDISVLTEKGNIAAEILTCQNKQKECETNLKSYDIQTGNCNILANTSGYISMEQDLKQGAYVQEGMCIGSIYPEAPTEYYAEIYVENGDIAKIAEGQAVKFEIAAYPSEEYGYFTGRIDSIAKDITVDQSSGSAYYMVKVKCDSVTVQNKEGKTGTVMNGMACQAKVVVEEENVLHYLLKKIDLID